MARQGEQAFRTPAQPPLRLPRQRSGRAAARTRLAIVLPFIRPKEPPPPMSANPFAAFRSEVVDSDPAARGDHGGLPAAASRMRAAAARRSRRSRPTRPSGSRRWRAAWRRSCAPNAVERRRGAHSRIFAVEPEGVALMCLAEALLRIPDAATRDALIRDKLRPATGAPMSGPARRCSSTPRPGASC